MSRKAGELKKRCWLAKQRLKMGYFDSVRNGQATAEVAADANVSALKTEKLAAGFKPAQITVGRSTVSVADEKMYRKVCAILDSDEIALNPIGQLIERDVYEGLDASSKQRYILELSDKFRELKERYYKERNTGA